jgi:hypothetical protein
MSTYFVMIHEGDKREDEDTTRQRDSTKRQGKTKQDEDNTRQHKARQSKAWQVKTRRIKTRQDKITYKTKKKVRQDKDKACKTKTRHARHG